MNISETRQRALAWPEGSGAREALLDAVAELERQEGERLVEMEGWLDREWSWLDANEQETRYPDREQRWLDALSRYEGAYTQLHGDAG